MTTPKPAPTEQDDDDRIFDNYAEQEAREDFIAHMTNQPAPTKLRLEFSVHCDECGQEEQASFDCNETQARTDFHESGWRLNNEVQLCPACVEDKDEQ